MKQIISKAISRLLAIAITTLIIHSMYVIGQLGDLFGKYPTYLQWLAIVCIIDLVMNPLESKEG